MCTHRDLLHGPYQTKLCVESSFTPRRSTFDDLTLFNSKKKKLSILFFIFLEFISSVWKRVRWVLEWCEVSKEYGRRRATGSVRQPTHKARDTSGMIRKSESMIDRHDSIASMRIDCESSICHRDSSHCTRGDVSPWVYVGVVSNPISTPYEGLGLI
jgi:hypothetical protein